MYVVYIIKWMLKNVCDKLILVYIADNIIVDTGNNPIQNEIVFQIKYDLVFNFDFK